MKLLIFVALCLIGVVCSRRNRRQSEAAPEAGKTEAEKGTSSDFFSQSGTNSGDKFTDETVITRTSGCDGPGTACVPYYQCDQGKIITDGAGLIDIRVGETLFTQHSECKGYLEVCCKEPNSNRRPDPIPHTPGCGHRNNEGVHARITGINVTETQFGEYPWMVAVLRVENIGNEEVNLYLCGGSLIQPNVVLTAAHCVVSYETKTIKVRAGEWNTQKDNEPLPHQDRIVSNVIIHPDFNGGSLWNDFAVLILETPFILAPNVDTICLPEPFETFDHVNCVATGWGKDKFGKEGEFQNVLKQVPLQVVPQTDCENALRNTRLGEHFELHYSFVCAGGEKGIDTCKGDGGSPLVCARPTGNNKPVYTQVGIVAWGIGCGENEIPGVYADVTSVIDFIYTAFTPYLTV